MSTKKSSESSVSYNTPALNAYNANVQQMQGTVGEMAKNPLQNSFFAQNLGMANRAAGQRGAARNQNIMGNLNASGLTGRSMPGFAQAMIAQNSRATSAEKAGNFNMGLNQANQMRQFATGIQASFQPLQTGSKTTETTSGLGTWLPQLAAFGINAGIGAMTGGASTAAKAGASAASSAPQALGMFGGGRGFTPSNPFNPSGNPFTAYIPSLNGGH